MGILHSFSYLFWEGVTFDSQDKFATGMEVLEAYEIESVDLNLDMLYLLIYQRPRWGNENNLTAWKPLVVVIHHNSGNQSLPSTSKGIG